jgi:hypothetical protein
MIASSLAFVGCGGGGGGGNGSGGGEVVGRVIAATTGLPLEGASVDVGGQVKVTPESGEFAFTGVPVSVTTGYVQLAGYDDAAFTFDAATGPDPSSAGDVLMVVSQPSEPQEPYTAWGVVELEGKTDAGGTIIEVVGRLESYLILPGENRYYLWLAPGVYTLRASAAGYQDHEVQGVHVADRNVPVRQDFSLAH